ncbi:unnamed protein product [Vitrella brassicaformis CCMP3155]|uniref:Uncharacterized protein n=1 Tax=Vitrella brassicaformis (strain CCMP3155) TaxID=1169540 RepID=A0A0G4EW33_VITBC|nr:unnamed protein product [Vitrella brassicaformis CCMP3155]|mmetsp:Transcript_4600/g.10676  ORF Transcript_4600/g.10676 Transcript_4600/m.10676 type:complete len:355 (-) Transcript_4600:433-1497(-)|eukprot:CEM02550.1 unnamed protein product [Vitrella brassicaformis CCMP3155]
MTSFSSPDGTAIAKLLPSTYQLAWLEIAVFTLMCVAPFLLLPLLPLLGSAGPHFDAVPPWWCTVIEEPWLHALAQMCMAVLVLLGPYMSFVAVLPLWGVIRKLTEGRVWVMTRDTSPPSDGEGGNVPTAVRTVRSTAASSSAEEQPMVARRVLNCSLLLAMAALVHLVSSCMTCFCLLVTINSNPHTGRHILIATLTGIVSLVAILSHAFGIDTTLNELRISSVVAREKQRQEQQQESDHESAPLIEDKETHTAAASSRKGQRRRRVLSFYAQVRDINGRLSMGAALAYIAMRRWLDRENLWGLNLDATFSLVLFAAWAVSLYGRIGFLMWGEGVAEVSRTEEVSLVFVDPEVD